MKTTDFPNPENLMQDADEDGWLQTTIIKKK